MHRLSLATLAIWISSALVMTSALAGQTPIRSKAELTRYLKHTTPGSSPLDALSPEARQRFLAGLDFGERGMRSVSLDEPENELTHSQVVALYTLFGIADYAGPNSGVTPARQRQLQTERVIAASKRGCGPDRCPESPIERAYDELQVRKEDSSLPDAQRIDQVLRYYDQTFGVYQNPERVRQVDAPDLRLLERAAGVVLALAKSPKYFKDSRMDLAELQRRGMADGKDYANLHQALVADRQFKSAAELQHKHPDMGVEALPTFVPGTKLPPSQPTVLSIDARTHTMRREAVNLDGPLRIVVIAGCHYSEDAARAIEADTQLRPLFAKHSIWLSSASSNLAAVPAWNRQFADLPMLVAWNEHEWSMLDSWNMPTYYVFRNGQLVKKFASWNGVAALKTSLRESGAL